MKNNAMQKLASKISSLKNSLQASFTLQFDVKIDGKVVSLGEKEHSSKSAILFLNKLNSQAMKFKGVYKKGYSEQHEEDFKALFEFFTKDNKNLLRLDETTYVEEAALENITLILSNKKEFKYKNVSKTFTGIRNKKDLKKVVSSAEVTED